MQPPNPLQNPLPRLCLLDRQFSRSRSSRSVQELQKQGNPNMVTALAGNKADLDEKRKVRTEPAYYEAFGLTVVESMTCGLPTFATLHGGPAEIIVHGVSGFHIYPYQGDKASDLLVDFFEKCKEDATHWDKISHEGLKRIYEKYTWKIYSERLMTLAGVYGFWKYVSNLDRRETWCIWILEICL